MKIRITLSSLMLLFACVSCAQSSKQNLENNNSANFESKITNKQFAQMLKLFREVSLPLNYKRESGRYVPLKYEIKKITKTDALEILKLNKQDIKGTEIDANYDDDIYLEREIEVLPGAHFKFFTTDFIGLIYRLWKGYSNDTCLVIFSTYTYSGILTDKMIIGEQYTREEDWISSVFTDAYHFKIFEYSMNQDNYIIKNDNYIGLKDENGPQSKVEIKSYEITKEGKIKKMGQVEKHFLQKNITDYGVLNQAPDDPMNQH